MEFSVFLLTWKYQHCFLAQFVSSFQLLWTVSAPFSSLYTLGLDKGEGQWGSRHQVTGYPTENSQKNDAMCQWKRQFYFCFNSYHGLPYCNISEYMNIKWWLMNIYQVVMNNTFLKIWTEYETITYEYLTDSTVMNTKQNKSLWNCYNWKQICSCIFLTQPNDISL